MVTRADGAAQPVGDLLCVRLAVEEGLDAVPRVSVSAGLTDYFTQWPERDALPIGEAAAGEDVHLTAEVAGKLLDKPRLPQSSLADHSHEHRDPLSSGPSAGRLKLPHLLVSTDQRRIQAHCQRAHGRVRRSQDEPIRSGTFRFDGRRCKFLRLPTDEDLAILGSLCERRCLCSTSPRT